MIRTFKSELYPCTIAVLIDGTKEEIASVTKDPEALKATEFTHPCTFFSSSEAVIMFSSTVWTVEDIAHEAFHASNIIFNMIGAKPDFCNDEPQAYLIDWLAECIMNTIKDNSKEEPVYHL